MADDFPRLPGRIEPRWPRRPQIRPPRLRAQPLVALGPQSLMRTPPVRTGGPGLPPDGFLMPTNSLSEWVWYWASMRVLDPDRDPREPPYLGGRLWRYQSPQIGGFVRSLGSAVVDFLYLTTIPGIVVRIVTYYWHLAAPVEHHTRDRLQLQRLATEFHIVDIYEQEFIGDETGEAAILLLKETLGLMRRTDPLAAGSALFVRNPLSRAAAGG